MQINYLVANLHLSLHGSKAVDHNFKGMLLNENIQISKYTYIYILGEISSHRTGVVPWS